MRKLTCILMTIGALLLAAIAFADLPPMTPGTTATNYTSTASTGTQPYACTSTTVNTNLNADSLDGHDTAYFQAAVFENVINESGATTLTTAANNKRYIATKSDGTTTFTIPDPDATTVGVTFYFLQTADQNLVVTCGTADSNGIVCDGVATSDNVTISTASHKIGAGMIVMGISTGEATYKWYVGGLNPESVLTPEAAD